MSHPAVFTSDVQCVRHSVERRSLITCCYRSRLVFGCCIKTLIFHKVM